MNDIGKTIGAYFFVIAALSILSMPVAYFYQNALIFEFAWVFMLILGVLLRKHNNPARLIVVGFNILGLIVAAGLFLFSFVTPALWNQLLNPQKLTLFAIKIPNPPVVTCAILMILTLGANVILIALLLSRKAKEEFSNKSSEPTSLNGVNPVKTQSKSAPL